MSRNTRIILGLVVVGVVAAAAAAAYIWVSGGSGEPTQPLVAPTLDVSARAGAQTVEAESMEDEAATEVATEPAAAEADATEAAAAAASSGQGVLFEIVPAESEVTFTLTEDLRGVYTVVVGTTDQVAGQIFVDFENPGASQVGVIRINAKSLVTDQEFRNRAIRGQILQVNEQPEWEFIDFTPTAIDGLPDGVATGEEATFQLTGDLRIRNIVQPATFDVTVTPVSDTRLEGTATTVVTRESFELTIPSVPSVANVSDEVTLQINFVAEAA